MTTLALFDRGDLVATSVNLTVPDDLDYDEWLALGGPLLRVAGSIGWWVGDWLVYGFARYGRTSEGAAMLLREVVELTSLEPATLAEYEHVAARVPPEQRVEGLAFSHHRVVAGMEPVDRGVWLGRALEGSHGASWSVDRLRREIAAAKQVEAGQEGLPVDGDGTEERPHVLRRVLVPVAVCTPRASSALRLALSAVEGRCPSDVWAALEGLLAAVEAAAGEADDEA